MFGACMSFGGARLWFRIAYIGFDRIGVYTSSFGDCTSFCYVAGHQPIGSLIVLVYMVFRRRGFCSELGELYIYRNWIGMLHGNLRHALHRPLAQPVHGGCGSLLAHLQCHLLRKGANS